MNLIKSRCAFIGIRCIMEVLCTVENKVYKTAFSNHGKLYISRTDRVNKINHLIVLISIWCPHLYSNCEYRSRYDLHICGRVSGRLSKILLKGKKTGIYFSFEICFVRSILFVSSMYNQH